MTRWTAFFLLSIVCGAALGADAKKQPPEQFRSVLEVVQTVPPNMYPADARDWTDIRIAAVNDVLKEKVKDKTATLAVTVREVKVVKEAEPDLRLAVVAEPIQLGQTTVYVWCYFDEDQKPRLTALNPATTLTITGKVWNPRFEKQKDGRVPLIIDLYKCQIPTGRKPAP